MLSLVELKCVNVNLYHTNSKMKCTFGTSYPRQEDCEPQEAEFGRGSPQISLEDEAGAQAAHHVAEEAEGPHQVDGVDVDPGVPGEVGLGGPDHCGHQTVSELGDPRHGEVDQDPLGGRGVQPQHHGSLFIFDI